MTDVIEQLEQMRSNLQKKIIWTIIISIGLIIAVIVISSLIENQSPAFIFVAMIIVFICLMIIAPARQKYRKYFKEMLMPLLLEKMDGKIQYDYNSGIDEGYVNSSKLFQRPDRFKTEDLIYGEIDGVEFKRADVHMEEKRVSYDKDGRRHVQWINIFKGKWFIFNFNKEFKGMIQVREGGSPYVPIFGKNKAKRVRLEDAQFNKKFKTYANDEHEAFYIITPPIILNMMELEKRHRGTIFFSFINNELHVAIYDGSDSFEAPIFRKIDQSFIDEQIADLKIMENIIKELKINRNIFKN